MIKNVLITGGTRGIGLGIAKELAKLGCNLVVNGMRKEDEVVHVINELSDFGVKVFYCQGDLCSSTDRENMLVFAIMKLGSIDVLINNAGVAPKERIDLLETTEESFDRVMDTNLKGSFFLTQQVALHMIENGESKNNEGKCIVNISSISATIASVNRGEYCLSKAGLSMMTKLFAARLGKHNIPVYEIRPGIIKTDMTKGILEKYQGLIDEGLNIQPRLGESKDVGLAVYSLVEGKFPYSSGQVIMIDGGLSVQRL